jgi:hypothetical protein
VATPSLTLVLCATLFGLHTLSPAAGTPLEEEQTAFSQRFLAAQPSERQQAIWRLDWEDHLSTALVRAKAECRPVLFIHVTNITGPSNFASGHC